jgi:hypothetical protein
LRLQFERDARESVEGEAQVCVDADADAGPVCWD